MCLAGSRCEGGSRRWGLFTGIYYIRSHTFARYMIWRGIRPKSRREGRRQVVKTIVILDASQLGFLVPACLQLHSHRPHRRGRTLRIPFHTPTSCEWQWLASLVRREAAAADPPRRVEEGVHGHRIHTALSIAWHVWIRGDLRARVEEIGAHPKSI
ncbi:hypothetical protein BJ875DRAFT_66583 [Amylocarpus encephaloides]|uniref:Uncharacterized protein n=1 Tax=Amylocarpus encephaloides TaxID=45428 RepID=A0A9P7YFP9_9HELO|nr:hypothetical protein BJ875DRAFT_66583 [Amylocarpus encephaloides]